MRRANDHPGRHCGLGFSNDGIALMGYRDGMRRHVLSAVIAQRRTGSDIGSDDLLLFGLTAVRPGTLEHSGSG